MLLKKVLPSGHEDVDSIRAIPSVIIVSSDGISEGYSGVMVNKGVSIAMCVRYRAERGSYTSSSCER